MSFYLFFSAKLTKFRFCTLNVPCNFPWVLRFCVILWRCIYVCEWLCVWWCACVCGCVCGPEGVEKKYYYCPVSKPYTVPRNLLPNRDQKRFINYIFQSYDLKICAFLLSIKLREKKSVYYINLKKVIKKMILRKICVSLKKILVLRYLK